MMNRKECIEQKNMHTNINVNIYKHTQAYSMSGGMRDMETVMLYREIYYVCITLTSTTIAGNNSRSSSKTSSINNTRWSICFCPNKHIRGDRESQIKRKVK